MDVISSIVSKGTGSESARRKERESEIDCVCEEMSSQGDMDKMSTGGGGEASASAITNNDTNLQIFEQVLPQEEEQIAPPATLKRKRSLPGRPDPNSEVIKLSPRELTTRSKFTCEVCNRSFLRHQNLQLHRRGHNLPWQLHNPASSVPPRKKVFVCPVDTCVHHNPSRALGDLSGIKKHFVRKHGEKIWKCKKCEKRYAVKADFACHSNKCGSQRYKCVCGGFFSRRDNFRKHETYCVKAKEKKREEACIRNPNSSSLVNGAQAVITGTNAPVDANTNTNFLRTDGRSADSQPAVGDVPKKCICGITFLSIETLDLHKLFCYTAITESIKLNTSGMFASSSTTNVFEDIIGNVDYPIGSGAFGNSIPEIGYPFLEGSSRRDVSSLPMKMGILDDETLALEMNRLPNTSTMSAMEEVAYPIGMKNMEAVDDELGAMAEMGLQELLDQVPIGDDGFENMMTLDSFCPEVGNMEDGKLAADVSSDGGGEANEIDPTSMLNDFPWIKNGGLGSGTASGGYLDANINNWLDFSSTGFGPMNFDADRPPAN